MSRILVTGAAGFIGSRVAERLLAQGRLVLGVDNVNAAYDTRLKRWRLDRLLRHEGFELVEADITRSADVEAVFASRGPIEAVINLAARAGVLPSVDQPALYYETNLTGVLLLLEQCRRRRVPRFVQASTSSVYGPDNPMPYREDQPTDKPRSPYAASKKAAELLCHAYQHLHGIEVRVLRYFTVYGPAGRPDMALFRFVQRISEGRPIIVYGDGEQLRDFTHVDDVARGTVAALESARCSPINLGSDRPIVLREAIALVERLIGRSAVIERRPWPAADTRATWADITRARETLGWSPSLTFEEGVESTVAWYRDNREWARDIQTD